MPIQVIRNEFTRSQILRFLVVGAINTGFSFVVYALLLLIGFHYSIANLVALLLGIVFGFKTQGRFVFQNSDNRLFGRFVIAWAIIYFTTILLIGHLVALGLNAYASGALALPISTVASFLTQKYFVFRYRPASSQCLTDPNMENKS